MDKNAEADFQVFIDRFIDAFVANEDSESAKKCLNAMLDIAFCRGQNVVLKETRASFAKIQNEMAEFDKH